MRRFSVAACAALLLLVPAAAEAAPTWLAPVALSPDATAPAVAAGSAGDAAAIWTRAGRLEARTRAPGGAFGDVQLLATEFGSADVAVAGDGTAIATWARGTSVVYAVRPPGGGFGAPQTLAADGGGGTVGVVRIAMNGRGDTLIAYGRDGVYASLRPSGGGFETPVRIGPGDPCQLESAVGAGGHSAIAWRDGCIAAAPVRLARRSPGGVFAAAENSGTAAAISLAVDGDGTAALALERAGAILAAVGTPDGALGPAQRVSAENEVADSPAIAADGGAVVAVFRSTVSGGSRMIMVSRGPGGGFTAPAAISEPGVPAGSTALVAAGGSAVATWLRDHGEVMVLESAAGPSGGALGPAVAVSATDADAGAAQLAADADGNAIAAFGQNGLVGRVLDAAGPVLNGIDMRGAGFAQEPYQFAVSPADAWSGVASSAFDFGEGTSRPGPSATYAFARPGPHAVTISATDTVGNVSAVQRPFEVAPALDRTPPVITRAKLDARRFRVAGRPTAVIAAVKRGTRFRYTLSEPAQVTIFFERVRIGRRSGKTCRRPRRGSRRRGKICRIYQPAGLLTRTHPVAGKVSVRFSGRIVASNGPIKVIDERLRPGRYRATLVAADDLRNISKRRYLAFTIVR